MDVGAPLVADGEAAKAVEPCQRSLDDSAVLAQPFAAVYASPGNAGRDPALSAFAPATVMVISLVSGELVRAIARAKSPSAC